MDSEELKEFLKNNLRIRIDTDYSGYDAYPKLKVSILFNNEVIDSDYVSLENLKD